MGQGSDGGSQREGRRQPQQTRSQETHSSLVDAAAELFAAQGYEQTTTHQIASRAGVSVGALYRYFDDKQAVLRELYSREVAAMRRRLVAGFSVTDLSGQDLRGVVRATMALAFRISKDKPGLQRVLAEQSRKLPELVELRRAQEEDIHAAILNILSGYPGARLPDLEVGSYLVRLFIESLIEDYVYYRGVRSELDQERVIDAATDFLIRYIIGRID